MVYVNYEVVLSAGTREPAWLRSLASSFEGRASATFVTLAGIGLVLLGKRGVILGRGLFLLVLGYLWQIVWSGDILHYYGFYLAVGAACLTLRARWLWALALASIGGFALIFQFVEYGSGWHWLSLEYPEFWTATGQVRNLFFNGWHPLFPWLAFLFGGMALGRWGIAEPTKRRVALVVSAAAFVAAYLASSYLGALSDERPVREPLEQWYRAPGAFWGIDSIPPGPLYVLSAGASAVFVIASCVELTSPPAVRGYAKPLALCGQLALTFYLAHVLFLYFGVAPLMSHFVAEEIWSDSGLVWAATGAAVFGVGAILFATAWRARFRRGPLESVMRRLCG